MATRYYRVPLGGNTPNDVTEAGSSSLVWVEVQVVYDLTGNNKEQAIKAVKAVADYLVQDTWPPV